MRRELTSLLSPRPACGERSDRSWRCEASSSAIRVRGSSGKLGGNDFKHACHVSQNVVIPKPQNPVILIGQPFVSDLVSRIVGVLTAIGFHDQAALATNEIDRIRPEWLLPNEFESIQPARTKLIPEGAFGVRDALAQVPRAVGLEFIGTSHVALPPHPDRIRRCDPTSPRKRGEVRYSGWAYASNRHHSLSKPAIAQERKRLIDGDAVPQQAGMRGAVHLSPQAGRGEAPGEAASLRPPRARCPQPFPWRAWSPPRNRSCRSRAAAPCRERGCRQAPPVRARLTPWPDAASRRGRRPFAW